MRNARFVAAFIVFIVVPTISGQGPKALPLAGDYAQAHDPSIAKDRNTYYVFTTSLSSEEGQFPIRC